LKKSCEAPKEVIEAAVPSSSLGPGALVKKNHLPERRGEKFYQYGLLFD
jgi:hypothetical protein